MNAVWAEVTGVDLAVVVQSTAAGELPPGARAIQRPPSSGARRALGGLRPVGPADLIHGLDVDLPFSRATPLVTTIHDLSVFDTPGASSTQRAAGERLLIRRAIRRADAVLAVSRFTAERIEHHFGREAVVTPLAPANMPGSLQIADDDRHRIAALRHQYQLPDRFVLQVATVEPRKDGVLLAEVCHRLNIPLVLAGSVDRRCRVPATAHHIGRVSDDERDLLMDTADIVAYISRYEGFGLPPIEAMARARPVVATAVGALPDVTGDGAILVSPGDDQALEKALRSLWFDSSARTELAARGARVAAHMSWQQTARLTLAVYRQLGVVV